VCGGSEQTILIPKQLGYFFKAMHQSREKTLAVKRLKSLLSQVGSDEGLTQLVSAKDEVLDRFQDLFSPDGIEAMSQGDFRKFLMYKNNKHWIGLQRMGPAITEDMAALKLSLHGLLDEQSPIAGRLNQLSGDGKLRIKRLGKAVQTPILMICYPDKYGVWNRITEEAMMELGIWPSFDRGTSIGERYDELNKIMLWLTSELGTDLWTLDALWWRLVTPLEVSIIDDEELELEGTRFGMERHLHDFLFDNWENTVLGKEWDLAEDGGDIKGYGYERTTSAGKIDLLAFHKTDLRWLVIELKKGQTSDQTVGQVLRYMGWVKTELAKDGESVEGLIIGLRDDEKLRYALKATQGIQFMRYEVEFRLLS
jgi:hypothetical protein